MRFIVLDAETYWAPDYTLSRMTNESYIRDPRFKNHGWGVLPVDSGKAHWFTPDKFRALATNTDWSDVAVICHNTRFDGAILGWHYGIRPRLWIDTMGMYRALHPELRSHSLAALAMHFNFGIKGNADWSKGKHTLTPREFTELGNYCALMPDSDCWLTHRLFKHAWDRFPAFERMIMDMTLRMFIEPILEIDRTTLETFLKAHRLEKEDLLRQCGLDRDQVMSNEKFAEALRKLGVEPPLKPSPSNPNKQIFAFAKTDEAMDRLADDSDPRIQVLAAARLGNKSTQLETRAAHLIQISERGNLPIPLNYWGAKITGRDSGGDKLNMQNFKRGSVLRDGVVAPPGYKIVVGDSSNIELRLVMVLAGQVDQINMIRHYDSIPEDQRVTDLYCDFGTSIYGRTITKRDVDERFVGKQGMLSLQYMASGPKFGNMMRQKKHPISAAEAERIKDVYRRKHKKVVDLWYYCDREVIPAMARGDAMRPVDVNGWFLTNGQGFALPGDLGVQYPRLHRAGLTQVVGGVGFNEWVYDSGRGLRSLYGAKVVENLCQHAARQVVMYQAMLVNTRYPVVHRVHDELVCCVPEEEADACAAFMLQCLSTAPKWTRGQLPVTGEVGVGDSYGEAK